MDFYDILEFPLKKKKVYTFRDSKTKTYKIKSFITSYHRKVHAPYGREYGSNYCNLFVFVRDGCRVAMVWVGAPKMLFIFLLF